MSDARDFTYDGTFPLAFLRDDETVSASGDHDGACIISGPRGEHRVPLGATVTRNASGNVAVIEWWTK